MIRIIFVFIILINLENTFAQKFNGSLIIEGASIFSRVHYPDWDSDWEYIGKDSYEIEPGCGIYWSGKWVMGDDYEIDIRPGIFIAPKIFSSIQLGFNLRRKFCNDYFGVLGLNLESHGVVSNQSGKTLPKAMTYILNVAIGKKISKYILLLVSLGKTLDNYYGSYFENSLLKNSKIYLNWILKIGIEWDF